MNIILKEELVLTWLVQQKTTDTIEQVSLLLLIQLQVQLINQQIQWYVVGQVSDKVLEKLIEDEDFVAGGQNSSNPMRNLIIKHRNVHKIQLLLKYLGLHFCFQFSSAASAVQEISASRCLSRWRTSTRSSAIMVTNYTLTNTNTNTINTQIRMTDNHWHKALRLHKHPITKSGGDWQWDH